jgi:hypothetical protein
MTASGQEQPGAAAVEDTGLPKIVVFKRVSDPVEAKRACYRFEVRTTPRYEDDAGRWVGDLTLSNVNPYTLAPASPGDCGLAGQDGHDRPCRPASRRAAYGYGADLDGRGVLPAAVTPGWGRRVDILAPPDVPAVSSIVAHPRSAAATGAGVGRHGRQTLPASCPPTPGFGSQRMPARARLRRRRPSSIEPKTLCPRAGHTRNLDQDSQLRG